MKASDLGQAIQNELGSNICGGAKDNNRSNYKKKQYKWVK